MKDIRHQMLAFMEIEYETKMPTITITGDTTQEALEQVLYQAIGKYGKELNLHISKNLRFVNQNKEIKELLNKLDEKI